MVAIDTESTGVEGIRDGRDYAVGVSIAYRTQRGDINSLYLPFKHHGGDNLDYHLFVPLIQQIVDTRRVVYHNAKFDLESLRTLGINGLSGNFYDTMLLGHLVDENTSKFRTFGKLDSMAKWYLKDEGKKKTERFQTIVKKYGWEFIPAKVMCEYASWDANMTLRLYEYLVPRLKAEDLAQVWSYKMRLTKLLVKMERRGVAIDVKKCENMSAFGHKRLEEIVQELGGYNPGSPKDLNTLIIEKLGLPVVKASPKTGKPSFDKKAMEEYDIILDAINDETAKKILEYRGWQKSVSSNYEPYVSLRSPDGRLRPNYKQHGTVTGRLSCEKPNLQQIPRAGEKAWNGEMKQCFVAAPGYVLLEADYSQLELRLATAYIGDEALKAVFNEGRDIFTEMSEQIGLPRHQTKTLVYTTQYGGGVNRLSLAFGLPTDRARAIRENYFKAYPGFQKVAKIAATKAISQGKLQIWSGRYRHFQDPKSEGYKAFNSIIQGGAADIVERTMLRLDDNGFNTDDCRMLLQVHDSVVFEVRQEIANDIKPAIAETMARIEPDFDVRFAVDVHEWGK